MSLLQKHHAQSALTDASAYGEWQAVAEQLLMEIELTALLLMLKLQLKKPK